MELRVAWVPRMAKEKRHEDLVYFPTTDRACGPPLPHARGVGEHGKLSRPKEAAIARAKHAIVGSLREAKLFSVESPPGRDVAQGAAAASNGYFAERTRETHLFAMLLATAQLRSQQHLLETRVRLGIAFGGGHREAAHEGYYGSLAQFLDVVVVLGMPNGWKCQEW